MSGGPHELQSLPLTPGGPPVVKKFSRWLLREVQERYPLSAREAILSYFRANPTEWCWLLDRMLADLCCTLMAQQETTERAAELIGAALPSDEEAESEPDLSALPEVFEDLKRRIESGDKGAVAELKALTGGLESLLSLSRQPVDHRLEDLPESEAEEGPQDAQEGPAEGSEERGDTQGTLEPGAGI